MNESSASVKGGDCSPEKHPSDRGARLSGTAGSYTGLRDDLYYNMVSYFKFLLRKKAFSSLITLFFNEKSAVNSLRKRTVPVRHFISLR